MYISIDKDFLDKTSGQALEEAKSEYGETSGKQLLYSNTSDKIDMEIGDKGITASVTNELGFFSIDIPLDTDNLVRLLELSIKKFNKIKTVMEGLK